MTSAEFITAALRNAVHQAPLDKLGERRLPDAWVVAGSLTQTGRAVDHGIDMFLIRGTQAGIRRNIDGGVDVYAPAGLDDIAEMIVRPNPTANFSADAYWTKAARWQALWPELTVMPA